MSAWPSTNLLQSMCFYDVTARLKALSGGKGLNIGYSTSPKLAVHPHYRNTFIAGQCITYFC